MTYRIAMKTPDETLIGLRTYRKKAEALVRAGTIRCAWAGLFEGASFKVVKA